MCMLLSMKMGKITLMSTLKCLTRMIGKVLGWIVDAAMILMNIIWAVRYADEGNTAKTVLFCTYLVVLILLIKLNQIERILKEWRGGVDGSTSM